jgi:signal transduction histidine kinase/ligand-binding sensor domain-containing protein/DNA-binding response OmpR family regulator
MRDTTSAGKLLLLLSLFLANVSGSVIAQQDDLTFETLPLDQGASTHVSWILQDRTGFIWVAAWSGLYMYDGYGFVSYKHDPDDTSSIANNGLSTIYEDKAGVLWLGSWSGLERFDRATGTFKHFTPNPQAPTSDPSNNVCTISEDKSGTLWVGAWGGLYQFDRFTGRFSSLRHDSTDPGSIAHNSVQVIYEDKGGSLWFGTPAGLDKFSFETHQFIHCLSNSREWRTLSLMSIAEYSITSILGDDAGMIWLGTNRGLVEYNPKEGTSVRYEHPLTGMQVAPYARTGVVTMCRDPLSASLWTVTANGLFTFRKESGTFVRRAEKAFTSLCVERSGTLLVGTDTELLKSKMARPPFRKYPMGDIGCGPGIGVDGFLWIFGYKKGWQKFDPRTGQFVPYSFGDEYLLFVFPAEQGGAMCFSRPDGSWCIRDSLGNVAFSLEPHASVLGPSLTEYTKFWSFGVHTRRGYYCGSNGGGVYLLDPRTKRASEVLNLQQSICWIYEDGLGFLWAATVMGRLVRYDQVQATYTEFVPETGNPSSWNGKPVNWVCEDSKGRLWFATSAGVARFERSASSFTHFTEKDGLLNNDARGIKEDDHGCLWVSTTKGISKFDPETGRFMNYDASYGLDPAADVFLGGMVRAGNGEMFFGGAHGLTGFHPDSIRDNLFIPPIVITSFRKFNIPYPVSNEIRLPYDENFISFEFAALSYISPEKNQYAYMMEGVDRDWVYCGTRHYASYPNLNPGDYVFRVKGSNNEGVWNKSGTSIAVVISPPWWRSRWAYGFYILALLSAAYGAWKMQMRRVKIHHEYEMSKFEAAKLHEVDELKSRFFANISHEFRTPLTLILGPIKRMRDASDDEQAREDLGLVHRNATRLLELVNQLLDLSRLESGNMKLQAAPENIIPLLKGLLQSFCSYAERKNISMAFTSSAENIVVYFDREKLQKIITNILSNAFKFTPQGGRVELSVTQGARFVSVRISDTGIGIPAGEIPRIFDRFYQVDGSHAGKQEGTGIGLSLTRELVELHKGTITVESEEGRGTAFTVRLPLGKAHLKPEEVCEPQDLHERKDGEAMASPAILGDEERPQSGDVPRATLSEPQKPALLIVEDNGDVRQYIRRDLEREYTILEARDGADGWNTSIAEMPDIIVSDVMMPKLDGFALCAKLKGDERTSHIPVILLTAKASSRDKIEGFETGADDYIMKPFEPAELRARLRNLLDQKARLHEYFRKHGLFEIEEQKITPVDQKFLQNAVATITEHLSDPAFGVESLAGEMAVSRSLLLKKMEALIGELPSEFIKRTRLNKAARLIEHGFGNITEIAFEVGFNNPSYFAECFRKQFGCPPSRYHRTSANR